LGVQGNMRDEWELKLADLQIELGLARAFLFAAEIASRPRDVACARELIGVLLHGISEHHCQPKWSRPSCLFPGRPSKALFN